jgi:hypothetical protein
MDCLKFEERDAGEKRYYCSAVQCSAVQCSELQCSAVQCSAVQCSAVQCSELQCSAVQYSAGSELLPAALYVEEGGAGGEEGAAPQVTLARAGHCTVGVDTTSYFVPVDSAKTVLILAS